MADADLSCRPPRRRAQTVWQFRHPVQRLALTFNLVINTFQIVSGHNVLIAGGCQLDGKGSFYYYACFYQNSGRYMKRTVSYQLRYSRRAKRLRLEVVPGEVRVTAPPGTGISVIEEFVQSREKWVMDKLSDFASISSPCSPAAYTDGSEISVLGKKAILRVAEVQEFVLRDDILYGCLYRGMDLNRSAGKWLDGQLLSFVNKTVEKYSSPGLVPSRIRLGNARTRWGSCSPRGVIMINRKLVHAPPEVVEYVAVHELVHLKHRNHSPLFWNTVEQTLGDVKSQRKWLRLQGAFLLRE